MTLFITLCIISLSILSCLTSSLCWVDITIASILAGLPSLYSIVTWLLPSGRRYESVPFFLTSESLFVSLCAREIGIGISSGVSLHAKPNIIPWSPAPVASISSSISPFLCSSASSTPIAISGDCSSIAVSTAQVSLSKPYFALV